MRCGFFFFFFQAEDGIRDLCRARGRGDGDKRQTLDKANETAAAGYYYGELKRGESKAELTTTARVGYHKYTFAEGSTPFIKFDLDHTLNKSWGNRTTVGNIEIIDEYTIRGQRSSDGWANNQHVYFYAKFNQPIVKATALIDGVETGVTLNNDNIEAVKTIAYLEFAPTDQPLELKVGLSHQRVLKAQRKTLMQKYLHGALIVC